MATTKCTERVNLSLTKDERAHLERIAEREDREITYLAGWLVRWALDRYDELDMSLTVMKNADFKEFALEIRSKERLRLRRKAQMDIERQRMREEERGVPTEQQPRAKKRAWA